MFAPRPVLLILLALSALAPAIAQENITDGNTTTTTEAFGGPGGPDNGPGGPGGPGIPGDGPDEVAQGTLEVVVNDAPGLLIDPFAELGVERGIANAVGVSESQVSAELFAGAARLQRRRLQAGTVSVHYVITLPRSDTSNTGIVVISRIQALSADAIATSINEALIDVSTTDYDVSVSAVGTPTLGGDTLPPRGRIAASAKTAAPLFGLEALALALLLAQLFR